MASLRDIKTRIKAVRNIKQITQAMKMVAAARLRRCQARVTAGKPYSEKMRQLVSTLSRAAGHHPDAAQIQHPLLEQRAAGTIGFVLITSDKGLCGSYNGNIIRKGVNFVKTHQDRGVKMITIGKKGTDFFRRRNYGVQASFSQIGVTATFSDIKPIADAITSIFLDGTVSEVHIGYTEFVTVMQQRPTIRKFLPIEPPKSEEEAGQRKGEVEYLFEPPAEQLLATLLPRYVNSQVYQMLIECVASEFGARMTAMSNATENAGELIKSLDLTYNKARQASITKELLEVVSGAEALRAG